ncbi:adenylyltransferase/cytidyltransferase family protein [Pontimicrobium sp. IMCC45349]|uniref:adenylyltransferase/cytidyltransferase family protein n=1 Tax=Pontimicrobium sp. IMCC45349 TaxID=3391574 RepID=UPI0039A1589A
MENINIEALSGKYSNWQFEFNKSSQGILWINGESSNDIDEMFDMLKEISAKFNNNVSIKISNTTRISIALQKKREGSKYSRMYTSGCFDIFHYGHLNILKRTKEICDYLIVGVSTDELIEKEKGRKPVIPFNERLNVVKAIKYVDEVIPQVDKNKQRVVDEYKIDAISVGDDWRGRFPKTTCPVEYFTYTASVSSTILKEALKLKPKI